MSKKPVISFLRGLIFRVPINHDDKYLGQTSIVINWDVFVRTVIESEFISDLDIRILSINSQTGTSQLIYGDSKMPEGHYEKLAFELPGGRWELLAYPKTGWPSYSYASVLILILGIIMSTIMSFLLLRLLSAHEKLAKIAYLDTLTGLPNRKLMKRTFDHVSGFADRSQNEIAIFVIDLDNFKCINDHYGHEAGDLYLQEFSGRLSSSIRKNDALFRTGGDEFLLYICNLNSLDDISSFLNNLMKTMKPDISNKFGDFKSSFSYGYSIYPESKDMEELIRCADLKMYEMKKNHKKSNLK